MAGSGGAFKDVLLAIAIVGAVLGGLFLFTGVWPPMVVVESGSMMHATSCPPPPGQPELCDAQVGYGKLGTIDPGDMVFVQKVNKREDVTPLAEGTAKDPNARNYGKPGDVVVYFNFENVPRDDLAREQAKRQRTPIIHRAIAYVEVSGVNDRDACRRAVPGTATYSVFWDGRQHNFGSSGVYLPEMGFGSPQYSQEQGYRPCWSGFLTKGDNPVSNQLPDQALGGATLPGQPIEVDWIEGRAIGELPWFGLIKLALSSSLNYPCASGAFRSHEPSCDNGRAVRVLNAYAPADLWVMLGVSLAFIAIAPLGYDMYLLRRGRMRAEAEARGETLPPTLWAQLMAKVREFLGRARGGPPAPPEQPGGDADGAADPRQAFGPPPPPPAEPARKATPPSAPSPSPKPGAKFERVPKK